jgi:hypothetical protein
VRPSANLLKLGAPRALVTPRTMAKRKNAAAAKRELGTFARRVQRGRLVERVTVKRSELKGTRTTCKREKAKAKAEAAELRERRRALVDACRTASAEGREAVAKAKAALAAFRAEQRERSEASKRRAPKLRRTSGEARAESDDEVRRNVEPELHAVWRRVKKTIRGSARLSRTEAFREWCERNPAEVQRIQWEDAERDVDRMVAEYNAAGWDVEVQAARLRAAPSHGTFAPHWDKPPPIEWPKRKRQA